MIVTREEEDVARVGWKLLQMDGSRCDGTKKKLNFHEPKPKES